jgi:hypothetical protein
MHVPDSQLEPAAQFVPQLPQFPVSLLVSTQAPPHEVSPAAQPHEVSPATQPPVTHVPVTQVSAEPQ